MGPTPDTTIEYMGPTPGTTTEDMGPTPDMDNTNMKNCQPNISGSESGQIKIISLFYTN